MVSTVVLIGLTGQNAENAHFEKRAILVEFSGQKIKNLPLCRNRVNFSFSSLSARQSAPRFLLSLFLYFSAHFLSQKFRASINAPKIELVNCPKVTDSSLTSAPATLPKKTHF